MVEEEQIGAEPAIKGGEDIAGCRVTDSPTPTRIGARLVHFLNIFPSSQDTLWRCDEQVAYDTNPASTTHPTERSPHCSTSSQGA